jgi:ADP-ribose pyrophosphatase YjhB (NUDIX family)
MNKKFRNAARLVIINDWKLLLCKMWKVWWLPGWWIEWWETIKWALERESIEELWIKAKFDNIIFIQDYLSWFKKWNEGKHFTEFFCSIKNNNDFKDVTSTYLKSSHAFEIQDLEWFDVSNIPEEMMPKSFMPTLKTYLNNKNSWKSFLNYISWIV